MTFTPSATSSFSAGAVFWGLVWATLGKLNEWSISWASSEPIPGRPCCAGLTLTKLLPSP